MSPSLRAAARLMMFALLVLGVAAWFAGDLILSVILILGAIFGWRSFKAGSIRSLCGLFSVAGVYFVAVPLGKVFAGPLGHLLGLPRVPNRYLSILLVAGCVIFIGQVVGWVMANWHRQRFGVRQRVSYFVAMLLGISEGAALAYTLILSLIAIEPPTRMALSLIMDHKPWARVAYDQLVKIRKHSPTLETIGLSVQEVYKERHDVLEVGAVLAVVTRYPGAVHTLKSAPVISDILGDEPALKRIYEEIKVDAELKQAIKAGDVKTILNSRTVIRLIEDEELAQALARHREKLISAVIAAVPSEHQEQASIELAKIRGMSADEFKESLRDDFHEYRNKLDEVDPSAAARVEQAVRGQASEEQIKQDIQKAIEQVEGGGP